MAPWPYWCHGTSARPPLRPPGPGWPGSAASWWAANVSIPSWPCTSYARQQAVVWTRYASWQTVAPHRISMPELVNLLLDRRSQRAELAQAKNDFYTFQRRRIYQAVAF